MDTFRKASDFRMFLAAQGDTVMVNIIPSDECDLPSFLMDRRDVCLQFGYDMPVNIPDISISAETLSGTLSFNGYPYRCVIPWKDVYAITNEPRKMQEFYLSAEQISRAMNGPLLPRTRTKKKAVEKTVTPRHAIRPPPMNSHLRLVHSAPGVSGPFKPTGNLRAVQD